MQNFASYSKTYGSIGAVIVLLLYFYISAARPIQAPLRCTAAAVCACVAAV